MTSRFFIIAVCFCISAISHAQDLLLCDSSEARLSPISKYCQGKPATKFDIPSLKLQLEDIKKILQGAESSGGRIVPNHNPQPNRPSTILLPTHRCQARLLIDADLRISWLLTSEFEVTRNVTSVIFERQWRGGITDTSDIDGSVHSVNMLPQWGHQGLSAQVGDEGLVICAKNSCSTSQNPNQYGDYSTILTEYHSEATLKFKVTCQEL